ncbi:uncharacterized protein isoform X2 [Leptinotarsa decemlineata]
MMASSKAAPCWTTLEDLHNDLCAFSEIAVNQDDAYEPPLATIVQYNAQMRANHTSSIFDTQEPEEDVTYICSGRGRGGLSKFYRPGMPVTDDGQDFVSRKIREVSGVGYSNEIIEQSLREKIRKVKIPDSEFCDAELNGNNSNERTASPMSARSTSTQSINANTGTSSPMSARSASAQSISSGPESEDGNAEQQPPPLSVILKLAKNKRKAPTQKVPREDVTVSHRLIQIEIPRIEADSSSKSREQSPSNGSSISLSENLFKTPDSFSETSSGWTSCCESSSSKGEEPLSWRRESRNGRIYTKEWRKRPTNKDSFNINSDRDFPAL